MAYVRVWFLCVDACVCFFENERDDLLISNAFLRFLLFCVRDEREGGGPLCVPTCVCDSSIFLSFVNMCVLGR